MFALAPLQRNLSAALRDAQSNRADVRRSAAADLAQHVDAVGSAEVRLALERLLLRDVDATVRATAAMAIADGMHVELVPALLRALEDTTPRVQQMALLALGELGSSRDGSGFERVRSMLRSQLPGLRYQALVAWRRLGGSSVAEELVAATADEDAEVRWVAWSLIDEVLDPPALAFGDGAATLQELGTDRNEMLALLRTRRTDDIPRIRIVAAAVLKRLGDTTLMEQLLHQVEANGISTSDSVALAQRFGEAKYEPARGWLEAHARQGWFEGALGWPATVALAALGDAVAVQAILRELDTRSSRRRGRALEAVRQLRLVSALDKLERLAAASSSFEAGRVRDVIDAIV